LALALERQGRVTMIWPFCIYVNHHDRTINVEFSSKPPDGWDKQLGACFFSNLRTFQN
jgi:hypothetical protein